MSFPHRTTTTTPLSEKIAHDHQGSMARSVNHLINRFASAQGIYRKVSDCTIIGLEEHQHVPLTSVSLNWTLAGSSDCSAGQNARCARTLSLSRAMDDWTGIRIRALLAMQEKWFEMLGSVVAAGDLSHFCERRRESASTRISQFGGWCVREGELLGLLGSHLPENTRRAGGAGALHTKSCPYSRLHFASSMPQTCN